MSRETSLWRACFLKCFNFLNFVFVACSGASVQRAPSPSGFQNPPPFIGQPYRPGGVQRLDILNLIMA